MRSIRQLLTLHLLTAVVLTCLAGWLGVFAVAPARASFLTTSLALGALLGSATAFLHYLAGDGLKNACRSGLLCYAAIVAIGCLGPLLRPNWLAGFSSRDEFIDFSGARAKRALDLNWPPLIEPDEIGRVSYKHQSSRDSFSTWYRIELTSDAAQTWADHIHEQAEQSPSASTTQLERVQRTIAGPPPLRRQTGTTPDWWSPPSIQFRATETMLWYKTSDSGVARATYSALDSSTNTFWIYQYAAQHDLLWPRDRNQGRRPDM